LLPVDHSQTMIVRDSPKDGKEILSPDHYQKHLEPFHCFQGVGFIGWHYSHFASLYRERFTPSGDFSLTIKNINQGVMGCCVFTAAFALVKIYV